MTDIKIHIGPDVVCPICHCQEVENPNDPVDQWKFNIKAYKVCDKEGNWWSQCMHCRNASTKGWFK